MKRKARPRIVVCRAGIAESLITSGLGAHGKNSVAARPCLGALSPAALSEGLEQHG